jgi:hypothetical protein
MRRFAHDGAFHVAGLVDRVENPPGHRGDRAIRVQLEHIEADPITYHCSYQVKDKKLVRGELSQVAGRRFLFPDGQIKRS